MNKVILDNVAELINLYELRDAFREGSISWNEYNTKIQTKKAVINQLIIEEDKNTKYSGR